VDDVGVIDSTTSTWTGISERTLPRGVVAGVGVAGLLLLVVAARTEGYWQGLLINLGTGALLFAALEHMLYGTVQRVTKLVREALDASRSGPGIDWVGWSEQLSIDELPAVQRELQAIAPLPTEQLEVIQQELAAIDRMNMDERMKLMSYLWVLGDKYGVQPLRQVMAVRSETNAG